MPIHTGSYPSATSPESWDFFWQILADKLTCQKTLQYVLSHRPSLLLQYRYSAWFLPPRERNEIAPRMSVKRPNTIEELCTPHCCGVMERNPNRQHPFEAHSQLPSKRLLTIPIPRQHARGMMHITFSSVYVDARG